MGNRNTITGLGAGVALLLALSLSPVALAGQYEDGVFAYSVGDYNAAVTAFEGSLKSSPNHTEALYYLGMAHYKSKHYDEARRALQMALRVAEPYTPIAKDAKRTLDKIEEKDMANTGLASSSQSRIAFSAASLQDGSNYYGYINENGTDNTFDLSRPITIFVQNGQGVPGWSPEKEKRAIQAALASWKQALGNRVLFQIIGEETKADIVVRWAKDDPTDAGICKAYGWDGRQVQSHVDLYTYHKGTPFSMADLESTAIHEFGHALGINGHSPYEEDVMYYTFSPKQTGRLTSRDIQTMQMVYHGQ